MNRVRAGRTIHGMAALVLPFTEDGGIDWPGFEKLVARTVHSGLVPAVNMDTGFGPVLDDATRRRVLTIASAHSPSRFVAGAHVADARGASFDLDAYRAELATIAGAGGTPIVFPSFGLSSLPDDALIDAHAAMAHDVDRFLAFELGTMFHPAGRIFALEVFAELLAIPALVGCKHSSLDRAAEWERLAVRDARRPAFLLLTGNDRAIDMVVYGSDYLLGLATFAPDAFAARDAAWAQGDEARFWALNDVLQYLGQLAFRDPVPAYRHDAAMFLAYRGWIGCDATHPSSPTRPSTERELLADIAQRLDALLTAEHQGRFRHDAVP